MTPRLIGLVPAAGGGSRFGGTTPKQYADLGGHPLLLRTVERLLATVDLAALYVVLGPEDAQGASALRAVAPQVTVLRCGGASRAMTVRNAVEGLAQAHAEHDWVLVHDAARPCVPADALHRLVASLRDESVGALLAIPVADTLKRATAPSAECAARVVRTEERSGLWQAQTPQVFRLGLLREALAGVDLDRITDEAQAIEALAATGRCALPRLVPGSTLNIKVTYPADLALAAAIRELQKGEA